MLFDTMLYGIVVQVPNELMTNREDCTLYNSVFCEHNKAHTMELIVAKHSHWVESINEFLNETRF